jgi:hypothetical protein
VAHARATQNDDDAIALAPTALAVLGDGATLDLPCGAYYVTGVAGAALVVRVHGKAALFVDGDVTLAGTLQVALDAGAELDLVVAGNLDLGALSSPTPAATRLWIGGANVHVTTGALSGLVYAPGATLRTGGALNVNGALYVGGLAVGGDVEIRFDRPTSAAATCQ